MRRRTIMPAGAALALAGGLGVAGCLGLAGLDEDFVRAGRAGGSGAVGAFGGQAGQGASAGDELPDASTPDAADGGGGSGQGGSCAVGTKPCDQGCVPLTDPSAGCAADTCEPCPTAENATTGCDEAGACALKCEGAFRDCDVDPGCETDSSSSVEHCGACDHGCTNDHGGTSCSLGVCTPSCDPNFESCNAVPDDGCETDTLSDPNHCGGCSAPCPAAFNCRNGVCGCGDNDEACNAGASAGTYDCLPLSGADVCVCSGTTCQFGQRCVAGGSCG